MVARTVKMKSKSKVKSKSHREASLPPGAPPVKLFKPEERLSLEGFSESEKKRIREIATEMVTKKILSGEVNMSDTEAFKAAVKEAGQTARASFIAVLETMT